MKIIILTAVFALMVLIALASAATGIYFYNKQFKITKMDFQETTFNSQLLSEIFAQRGKEVKRLSAGKTYLLTKKTYEWDIIHLHRKSENELLWTNAQLFDDGDMLRYGYIRITDMSAIFEATPDQIALLQNEIDK